MGRKRDPGLSDEERSESSLREKARRESEQAMRIELTKFAMLPNLNTEGGSDE